MKNVAEERDVDPVGSSDGQRKLGQIESKMNEAEPLSGAPETLDCRGQRGQGQSLR